MEIQKKEIGAGGIKFYIEQDGKELGRAYLYVLTNDLHDQPFGLMEDVFLDESLRGNGVGSELVQKIIEEAANLDCYKLICTCRHQKQGVHALYQRLGFNDHGKEFRINF